jgi:glutamine synthetase
VFLGETLTSLLGDVVAGKEPKVGKEKSFLKMGAHQLAQLFQDNTDRNRTSPFAFTGNKFEFRAVGSSASTGFPTTILVAALTEIFEESYQFVEGELQKGCGIEDALKSLTKKWYLKSAHVVFNGDGYSQEWVEEAKKRGLPNYRTTPEALKVFKDEKQIQVLSHYHILNGREIETRYNVLVERYLKIATIEWETLHGLLGRNIFPSLMKYKKELLDLMVSLKSVGQDERVEKQLLSSVQHLSIQLHQSQEEIQYLFVKMPHHDHQQSIDWIGEKIVPQMKKMTELIAQVEQIVPESYWPWPTYQEMLFIR